MLRHGKKKADIIGMELPLLQYNNRITEEKKKDLKEMIPYLPVEHSVYYEQIVLPVIAENE